MGSRWRLAIAWTLVALIGFVWAMGRLHLDSTPTVETAANNLRHLWLLWITSAAVWIGLTVMWMMLRRNLRDVAKYFQPKRHCSTGSIFLIRARDP